MLKHMKIAHRIMAGFAVAIIIFAAYGLNSTVALSRIARQADTVDEVYLPSMTAVASLQTNLAHMRIRQLRFLATEDPASRAEVEALIAGNRKAIDKALATYEALPDISTSAEREAWEKLTRNYTEYLRLSDTFQSLAMGGDLAAVHDFDTQRLRPVFNTVSTAADSVQRENENAASVSMQNCSDLVARERTISLFTVLFATALCILAATLTTRAIARPVRDLTTTAEAIAAGDYTYSTSNEHLYNGELIALLHAVRAMVRTIVAALEDANAKSTEAAREAEAAQRATQEADAARASAEEKSRMLTQAVAELQSVMERLSSSSEELAAQVEQSSRGAEEQSRRVAETATAIEEMNATVLEVARNAEDAARHSDQVRTEAERGASIVGEVVADMASTSGKAQDLKNDMSELEKQALAIGRIMNVISDIADQTNLLALNAAIEAARAGEAGRGFAVVADEVRKLAEKTMQATNEVGQAIKGIQSGTELSTNAVEDVVGRIATLSEKVSASGAALTRIVTAVQAATGQVTSIATASSQQSAASDEIAHSVEDINRISSETAEAMRQSSLAVTELAAQAQGLETLITRLRAEAA